MATPSRPTTLFVQQEEGLETEHTITPLVGLLPIRSTIIALDTNIVFLLLLFAKPAWEKTCMLCRALREMHQDCRRALEEVMEMQRNGDVDLVATETVVWELERHGFVEGFSDVLVEEVGVRVVKSGVDTKTKVQTATEKANISPSWTDRDINDFKIYLEAAALAAETDNEERRECPAGGRGARGAKGEEALEESQKVGVEEEKERKADEEEEKGEMANEGEAVKVDGVEGDEGKDEKRGKEGDAEKQREKGDIREEQNESEKNEEKEDETIFFESCETEDAALASSFVAEEKGPVKGGDEKDVLSEVEGTDVEGSRVGSGVGSEEEEEGEGESGRFKGMEVEEWTGGVERDTRQSISAKHIALGLSGRGGGGRVNEGVVSRPERRDDVNSAGLDPDKEESKQKGKIMETGPLPTPSEPSPSPSPTPTPSPPRPTPLTKSTTFPPPFNPALPKLQRGGGGGAGEGGWVPSPASRDRFLRKRKEQTAKDVEKMREKLASLGIVWRSGDGGGSKTPSPGRGRTVSLGDGGMRRDVGSSRERFVTRRGEGSPGSSVGSVEGRKGMGMSVVVGATGAASDGGGGGSRLGSPKSTVSAPPDERAFARVRGNGGEVEAERGGYEDDYEDVEEGGRGGGREIVSDGEEDESGDDNDDDDPAKTLRDLDMLQRLAERSARRLVRLVDADDGDGEVGKRVSETLVSVTEMQSEVQRHGEMRGVLEKYSEMLVGMVRERLRGEAE
ncbi:hypothetical protein HDV00_009645 [Rhizophlyctis rosea]|nr:hypothetical protein HDV00_009645 [Rhizophlyctis rosea]